MNFDCVKKSKEYTREELVQMAEEILEFYSTNSYPKDTLMRDFISNAFKDEWSHTYTLAEKLIKDRIIEMFIKDNTFVSLEFHADGIKEVR